MPANFTKDHCYFSIPLKSSARDAMLRYAMSQSFTQSGHNGKHSFLQITIPEFFIKNDPILSMIQTKWNIGLGNFRIHKMEPNTYYVFHTDSGRGASINMMLSAGSDGVSYFKVGMEHSLLYNLVPLVYEPDTFYLFNSQVPHGAICGESDRYLLSISLGDAFKEEPMKVFNEYRAKLTSKF
jgi:hypothetical protein